MEEPDTTQRVLYIFLDEGGNLDFSPVGTKYFTMTSVTKERPFYAFSDFINLKYDLAEEGYLTSRFHATEDKQFVRNRVFEVIREHLDQFRIDSLIVEKRKTVPDLQRERRFYPEMLGRLLQYVLNGYALNQFSQVLIFTDKLPVKRKKESVEKAIKQTLSKKLPSTARYRIVHHESQSNSYLQIADYCNWAIYRKWNGNDERSYGVIKSAIKSEFDVFRRVAKVWY